MRGINDNRDRKLMKIARVLSQIFNVEILIQIFYCLTRDAYDPAYYHRFCCSMTKNMAVIKKLGFAVKRVLFLKCLVIMFE